jgi:hypothetical protein
LTTEYNFTTLEACDDLIIDIIHPLKTILNLDKISITNFVFILHYKVTCAMQLFAALLVCSKQFFGAPIVCNSRDDVHAQPEVGNININDIIS